jgi:hypothetical protein
VALTWQCHNDCPCGFTTRLQIIKRYLRALFIARLMLSVVEKRVSVAPKKKGKHARKKKKAKKRVTTTVITRRTSRKHVGNGGAFGQASSAYIATLNNPFECPPVRLGFGTMIPTRIATAYCRGLFTLNSDGSGQLWFSPCQVGLTATAANGGFVMASRDGFTITPTFTGFVGNCDDQSSITTDADQYRVVSAGIRIFASIPRTSAPGVLGVGQYNVNSGGVLPNSTGSSPISTSALFSLPETELTFGYDPVQITWRPDDLDRFRFSNMISTSNSGSISLGPCLYATFNGCPPSATVFWEAVSHYECYSSSKASSQATVTDAPTVASEVPSLDSFWSRAVEYLSPTVQTAAEFMSSIASNPDTLRSVATAYSLLNPTFPRTRGRIGFRGDDWKV